MPNRWKTLLALLLCLLLTACGAAQPEAQAGTFTLTFLTIGKADAFLLEAPEGGWYLLDTGRAEDVPQILRCMEAKGVEALDGIFLSHGHKDHAGGLAAILDAYPTGKVYLSGADTVSYAKVDAQAIAAAHDVPVHRLTSGETLDLGGVTAAVWLPQTVDPEKENNNSVVLRLTHGENRFLMMGDAEKPEEKELRASGMDLRADVLKVGHHGKDDATSKKLLEQVQPSIALVPGSRAEDADSADEGVLERLRAAGAAVYVSESDGLAYDLISDGTEITVQEVADPDGA